MRARTAQNPAYETLLAVPALPVRRRVARRRTHGLCRVWNLKSIAIVFYFCLLLIFGRFVTAVLLCDAT